MILQRFADAAATRPPGCIPSARPALIDRAQPMLVGPRRCAPRAGRADGRLAGTRFDGDHDARQAGRERPSSAPGSSGSRPPRRARRVPGLPAGTADTGRAGRFPCDPALRDRGNLQAWLNSPERPPAAAVGTIHGRGPDAARPRRGSLSGSAPAARRGPAGLEAEHARAAALYPVVFLFGRWVQTPLLMAGQELAVLAGACSLATWRACILLNRLVPWASSRFAWWLTPRRDAPPWTPWTGAAAVTGLYCVIMALFSRM